MKRFANDLFEEVTFKCKIPTYPPRVDFLRHVSCDLLGCRPVRGWQMRRFTNNMFEKVKGRKFDFIVCNSPYLPPTEEYNDPELALAVEGGPTGSEFTIELLSKAEEYLKTGGNIYLIISSKMKNLNVNWKRQIIREEKFFFERLTLERFWK